MGEIAASLAPMLVRMPDLDQKRVFVPAGWGRGRCCSLQGLQSLAVGCQVGCRSGQLHAALAGRPCPGHWHALCGGNQRVGHDLSGYVESKLISVLRRNEWCAQCKWGGCWVVRYCFIPGSAPQLHRAASSTSSAEPMGLSPGLPRLLLASGSADKKVDSLSSASFVSRGTT
jgi:hypothetical protein